MAKTGGRIHRPAKSIDLQAQRAKSNTTVNNFDIPDLVSWLQTADKGDPTRQARISLEILEKDFDLAQLHATRAEAVSSIDADILPARDIPEGREQEAKDKADFVRDVMQRICPHPESGLEGMKGLYKNMQSALLPGYSISQIHWSDNIGSAIDGFEFFPQDYFIFKDGKGKQYAWPRLLTNGTDPVSNVTGIMTQQLHRNNWIVHTHLPRSGDMTRGGMIRPAGYLYLLGHYNIKNWARYNERHGMPFLAFNYNPEFIRYGDEDNTAAQAADSDYMLDWDEFKDLVENFANDGAAAIPKDEIELAFHEAMNSTGEVFEKFENMIKQKKSQLILGQDSTSASENANRSIGGIHYQVKHEILVRDCQNISQTIQQQIIAPLIWFNFGNTDLLPRHKFAYEPATDLVKVADWIGKMDQAGYEIEDTEEINKRFGVRFIKRDEGGMDADNSN